MLTILLLLAPLSLIIADGIPGGVTNVDVNDPENMKKIWKGLSAINAASTTPNYLVPVKVLSATTQVVSGTIDTWEVEMAETDCGKFNTNFDRYECVPSGNSPHQIYRVTLWSEPWLKHYEYKAEKIN
ncbi:hypothetical protein PMAYCL1PPCAC_17474 [Pristionchus mayeri]|uniref:Cystatin domain-containing protein n=1 Tax=Pristionchus mayeri TaxID=1317129 RepID=A0AAN5I0G6_9BILA|nr:hypothetical protein PMAYCL1PPCAC_17474 [Pristionchus mayeri]